MKTVVSIAIGACVLGLILGFAGPLWYPLDAASAFRGHLAGAVLLLGAAALALDARRAAAVAAVFGVVAALALGPIWRPVARAAAAECVGPPIAVATANLLYTNGRLAEIEAALVGADADILVTQETSAAFFDAATELRALYPHRVARRRTITPTYSVILWSKRPVRAGREGNMDPTQPIFARGVVDLGGGRSLGVLGVHLALPIIGPQGGQMAGLAALADPLPADRVVLGDFNAAPWSYGVRVAERGAGVAIIGGLRLTWRGRYPSKFGLPSAPEPIGNQIDHIMVSSGVAVDAAAAFDVPGSDHRGVVATIRPPTACV